jgi:threonine/homoserine/homoserine lactone efflux protein
MFGIWTGAFIHVIFAALGLSAILATSVIAFSVVKLAGADYLIWLGIQALRSKGTNLSVKGQISPKGLKKAFRQGVLASLLNPKADIFFWHFFRNLLKQDLVPSVHSCFFRVL